MPGGGIGRGFGGANKAASRPSASYSQQQQPAFAANDGGAGSFNKLTQFLDASQSAGPGRSGGGVGGGACAAGRFSGFAGGDNGFGGDTGFDRPPKPFTADNNNNNDGNNNEAGEERQFVEYVPEQLTDEQLASDLQRCVVVGSHYSALVTTRAHVTAGPKCVDPSFIHLALSDFSEANFDPQLERNIGQAFKLAAGVVSKPTAIQSRAIPIIMNDVDVMGCAQTGSGKSAAFMLPIINWILLHKNPTSTPPLSPFCIVLSPTRELSKQLYRTARTFTRGTCISCCEVYGATNMRDQRQRLQAGCDIITCTAGRLKHLIEEPFLHLTNCKFVVLDEADRLLDDSSAPECIDAICNHPELSAEHQTLMFSATFPPAVQQLAEARLRDRRAMITVGELGRANKDITQHVEQIESQQDKRTRLVELLAEARALADKTGAPVAKILVFCKTKKFCDILASFLSQDAANMKCTTIHGDREQRQREQALREFEQGECPVLLSTDVCARGIDIPDVDHVINFDLPDDIRDYVHRIGRTGRVGKSGRATSFYSDQHDGGLAAALIEELSVGQQPVPDFLTGGGGGGGSSAAAFAPTSSFGGDAW